MRGKNKIWIAMAAIFVATLAVSLFSTPVMAPIGGGNTTVYVSPSESGPLNPGDSFSVDVAAVRSSGFIGVGAFDFILSWNPKILRIDATTPVTEGPFLPSSGAPTFLAYSLGIAGNSIEVADLITTQSVATLSTTPQAMASLYFHVIGGGQTDLGLTVTLYDANFNILTIASIVGGHFWSPTPFVDFKWFVPNPTITGSVNVSGLGHELITDTSGNTASINTDPYTVMRPVAQVNPLTGVATSYTMVKGGTMFYGDSIEFDASGSYVVSQDPITGALVQSSLPDSAFHWVIRAGGVNTINGKDSRYESGVELPTAAVFSYKFPGALPTMYSYYGKYFLGFHDLNLTVTDPATGLSAKYFTFIRIFRLSPTLTKMINVPNHVSPGDTMQLRGKVQNRGGTNYFPWYVLQGTYMALGRMINAFVWAQMRFTIYDPLGNKVATLYTDAWYMDGTEIPTNPVGVSWTVPLNSVPGIYTVVGKGLYCGTGIGMGLSSTSSVSDTFEVLP